MGERDEPLPPSSVRAELIDFTVERQRHRRFVGREDVLAQLDEWLLGPSEAGWVVVTGGPGMGKSAVLSAWLARREAAGAVVPHHFVRRQDWDQPERIAAALAAQIEAMFPDLRDPAAKPEGRLIELLGRVSKRLGPSGDLVLLVDGLDEIRAEPGDNPLPRFLPHEVPPGIRLLCAMRPTYPHRSWVDARSPARRIDLDDRKWAASNAAVVRRAWEAGAAEYAWPPPVKTGLDVTRRGWSALQHRVQHRAHRTGEACLVLIYPPGPNMGKRFPLSRSEVVLGRGGDCDVQVDRDSVSRRHARVYRSGESWSVEDLQSTNGSYVNDVPMTKSPLHDGDFVKIGAAIFKFLMGTGIEASYHEEIYKMTIVDALTGAHSKRYFLEFLEREIARCARYDRPLSLLMFDIDHFKAINDKHGHLTGDYVLREMSRRLLGRVRREELLARYGGEEFATVLPETDLTGARTFGEQIRQLVGDQPFVHEGDTFPVTVSVGVACVEGEDVEVSTFIKLADDNLYRAKREGRNRVVAGGPK